MPMSQWPCQPNSLEDFMDENTIRFVLAGVAEKYRAPLTIVDTKKRYDPYVPRQQATQFCLHLRGDYDKGIPGIEGADIACKQWDDYVARQALVWDAPPLGEPVHHPCWLSLSDFVINLEVGGHRFVLLTGQRLPKDHAERKTTIAKIQQRILEETEPSKGKLSANSQDLEALIQWISKQPVADDEYLENIKHCAQDILDEFSNHWTLHRTSLEDTIFRDLTTQAQSIHLSKDHDVDWFAVKQLIHNLSQLLGCRIAMLFSHESFRGSGPNHLQNLLRFRAAPGYTSSFWKNPPHFNWNKSRLSGDNGPQILFGPDANDVAERGIKSDTDPNMNLPNIQVVFASSDLRTGCRTVLALGGFRNLEMVKEREDFLKSLLTTLSQHIHNLQLFSGVHHTVSLNKELAEFLAHQVRSQLQTLKGFQTVSLRFSRGEAGLEQLKTSSNRFQGAYEDLAFLSKFVYRDTPTLYDSDKMHFDSVSPLVLIEAAIEGQLAYAEERNVTFRSTSSGIVPIRADPFWFRIMLGHLFNNAIKYSRERLTDKDRWISVRAERDGNSVSIFIENFGLGILEEDLARIFEPRVDARRGLFQFRAGSGRGLFEARRIAYAHGGTISASSRHYTGAEVLKGNIEECITTFVASVPIA